VLLSDDAALNSLKRIMTASDSLIDRQIGDFIIRERIGQGGMATVYRAFQPSVNRDIALKIIQIKEDDQSQTHFRERFTQEAEMIAGLEHIHILPVYDYGVSGDLAYLAMRLLRGGTLREMMQNRPPSLDQSADLFRQFASGLAYAHSKGVIHRDLKPSNIMLDDAGNAFLTDFGLAKLAGESLELTHSGAIVGTPAYMSPEQLRGDPLDFRADIYSLGVILYQMLAGRPPFGGPTSDLVSTIYQHLEKAPPPLRELNPNIPPQVEAVVLRALEKDPADRYDNAEQMADDLLVALGRKLSSSGDHAIMMPSTSSVHRLSRRWAWVGGAIGIVVAIIITVGVLLAAIGSNGNAASDNKIPTVIAGEERLAEEAAPTELEIRRAVRALGSSGFIAYITCTMDTEYHATLAREMSDFAAQDSLRFRIYDSDTNAYREITQIEKARADGTTGLIICPLDPDLLSEALTSAQNAGIHMVIMHSGIPSYGGVLLAGDDYRMGLKAGRYAGQIIADEMDGQADVVILDYPDLPILVTRANGLEDGVLEFAPGAHFVGRYRGGTPELGEQSVSKLIADGVHFDVIVSINDAGAFGAITAMEKAGFDPESVIITSVDAEALAREYIKDGYFMRGSVQVDRREFARTAINAMVKLLAGSTVPETYLVPPGDMVTRETLAAETP
jgi:ABC-type sugar transport system substrate-binding protein/tRNA A-37 threonylcarbamoyl transferase component Bud32